MKIPYGSVKKICEASGLPQSYISNIIATRTRAGRLQAARLEECCKKIGMNIPKEIWAFGSSEDIKKAIIGNN